MALFGTRHLIVNGQSAPQTFGCEYSLEQWNWFSDITGCTWVTRTQCSVAKPFLSNCGSLELLFADFSMILLILSPLFSQQKNERGKPWDVREKTMQAWPGLLTPQKVSPTGTGTTLVPNKCFTVTCETERWWRDKKGQVMLGNTVGIIVSAFITLLERLSFAGAAKYIP